MGRRNRFVFRSYKFRRFHLPTVKMSEADAKDAFIIFDEAYEGNDVDCMYMGDILRALGCNVTNAKVLEVGAQLISAKRESPLKNFFPFTRLSKQIYLPPVARKTTLRD